MLLILFCQKYFCSIIYYKRHYEFSGTVSLCADGSPSPARKPWGKSPLLGGPRPDTGVWRNWHGPIFHGKAWADLKGGLRQGSSDWRGLMPSGIQTALAIHNELESGVHPQGLLSLPHSPRPTNSSSSPHGPCSSPRQASSPSSAPRPPTAVPSVPSPSQPYGHCDFHKLPK